MALGPRPESAAVMESLPSLPIHSSLLFVLIAGLFLAALIIRAQRMPMQPRHAAGLTRRQARTARRRVQRRRRRRRLRARDGPDEPVHRTHDAEVTTDAREGTMRQNMQQATVSPHAAGSQRSAPAGRFRIHWGRTLLAAIAALGTLAGLGTVLAAWLTALTWSVPIICGVVVLLSLGALQVSAALRRRRKRRARVEHAFQDAINSQPQADESTELRQRSAVEAGAGLGITAESAPFDALTSDSSGHGGPDSLVSLDEDGLPQDAERLFGAGAHQTSPTQPSGAEESAVFDQGSGSASTGPAAASWTPREVPHPKYLVAEKVERAEPEPLVTPQEPAPSADTKLKQPAAPAAPQDDEGESSVREESIDLDAVLKRRRA